MPILIHILFFLITVTSVASAQGYDWRDTAALEHSDRKKRLLRIARNRNDVSPSFYEYIIERSELPQLGADVPVMRVVFDGKVFFETDQYALTEQAKRVVDYISENLKKDAPDLALFIAGHADSRASDAYNYVLSVKRAEAFGSALRSAGAGFANMWTVGFGESLPIKPNNSVKNMAANRRVEFLFASKPDAIAVWLSKQATIICEQRKDLSKGDCLRKLKQNETFVAVPVIDKQFLVGSMEPKSGVGISNEELGLVVREESKKIEPSEKPLSSEIKELALQAKESNPEKIIRLDGKKVTQHKAEVAREAKVADGLEKVIIKPESKIFIDVTEEKITVGAPEL